MRHLHRKKETHSIQVELEEDFLLVRTDARLIVQLLINLLDNALKYTPEDSQILLHACKIQGDIHIQVSDNGPGIPDEKKEKVFEMFYCGANEIGDSRRSLGLGLALCRSIVTAHGGEIWVEDAKPHGACFHLTLPVGDMEIHE